MLKIRYSSKGYQFHLLLLFAIIVTITNIIYKANNIHLLKVRVLVFINCYFRELLTIDNKKISQI